MTGLPVGLWGSFGNVEAVVAKIRDPSGAAAGELGSAAIASFVQVFPSAGGP